MMKTPHIRIHGSGYPLVLFHGWGFDAQIWLSLLPALTPHYQLYLVDLPGFGLTPPMSWEMFKSALIEQLPVKFALLGWSMGGLMATKLTIEEPSRITHLVNVASSPHFIREQHWPGIDLKLLTTFYEDLASNPQQTLETFIQLQLQGQAMSLGHPPSVSGLREGLNLLESCDLRLMLHDVHQPVCYMFGHLDVIVPRMTRKAMEKRYPHFQYILFPKAAHAPFLSHPAEFIMALKEFLQ